MPFTVTAEVESVVHGRGAENVKIFKTMEYCEIFIAAESNV